MNVEYCPMNDMLADLMTKGLARDTHIGLMKEIGMRACKVIENTSPSSSQGDIMEATSGSVDNWQMSWQVMWQEG